MMAIITAISAVCGCITATVAAAVLFIRPVREHVLGLKKACEGQRCLLRSDMLHTYYKHRETGVIRQYEKENFIYLYTAYKALGGNSFIDDIYKEVRSWEVVS